jgi:hypothetical protein
MRLLILDLGLAGAQLVKGALASNMALQRTRALASLGCARFARRSPLNARPLGRIRRNSWILAVMVAMTATPAAKGASLVVPVRRSDITKPKNVWVVLSKYSIGSDGCCEDKMEQVAHFEPGISKVELTFENLEACPQTKAWCKYGLKWWGYTTMFGSLEPVVGEVDTRLPDIEVEEGIVLKGAVNVENDRPYQNAYIKLFHASLPGGNVQVQVGKDGTFSFIGLPAAGQVCWEFSSLRSDLMKVAGVLNGETELVVIVKAAQEITGCLRRFDGPVAGASVQLYYPAWTSGSIEIGSGQAGADGCFRILRDREAPAELKVYFGPTGRFRMPLPNIASAHPAAPLNLGIITLGSQ